MRVVEIITKKRLGHALSEDEIRFILNGYHRGEVPDYQISAFLMAVVFQGMEKKELACFTNTMTKSGEIITLPKSHKFIIDKHSTGGVGDKTSIALAPLLSSLNIGVAKLTGRGLGHTGGTIDKFESIQGFEFKTSAESMISLLEQSGIGLMGYSDKLVPLDKMLYTLRDVTSTVQSIPLIASSIMSKKLAITTDAILLDVKTGNGAFMPTLEEARALSQTMYDIGVESGRNIACLITNMNQPLGNAIGNSLEIIEAVESLKGNGPDDFTDLLVELAATSIILKDNTVPISDARCMTRELFASEKPLKNLAAFISLSGGNGNVVYDYDLLPRATHSKIIHASQNGYINSFRTSDIGIAAMQLGAGRATKEDRIDHAVGIVLAKKQGAAVKKGDALATIYYNKDEHLESSSKMLLDAIKISAEAPKSQAVILDTII